MHYVKLLVKKAVLCTALMCATQLASHPHNWIDLSTEFSISDQGLLTGFSQQWQFDQFFSMISYADLMNEYNDESIGLASTAMKMVANVGPDQYLSKLKVAGVNVALPVPTLYSLETKEVNGIPILILKMKFVLKDQPLVKNKTFTLKTYEPTFFIAMNYPSTASISITGNHNDCKAQLIQAKPSEERRSYATGLDRNMRDTDGLGDDFAEQINVQC